jgi:hypothetical protein
MAGKNVTVYIVNSVSGDSASYSIGSLATPVTTLGPSPAEHLVTQLNSGFNTLLTPQLPNPAIFMQIIPPSGSGVSMTLMGNTSDVGVQLNPGLMSQIALSPNQTSVVIKSGGVVAVDLYYY